jgi:hypothetical protein
MMNVAREHLMFTIWYLKEKDLIRQDQNSDFVISSLGADYVEERLPSHSSLYKLLKASETGLQHGAEPSPFPAEPLEPID